VATQGRSFWIIDDLSPLHQLDKTVANADFYLYEPKPSYRIHQGGRGERDPLLEGENHPAGVMFYYYLNQAVEDTDVVSLELLQSDGTVIKRFSTDAVSDDEEEESELKLDAKEGANLFVWDMRYPDAVSFDGIILYSANTKGPKAVPGTYRARLSVNGQSTEQDFEILKDPRVNSSLADLEAQFDFLMAVRNKLSDANQAVLDIRKLRADLDYLRAKLEGDAGAEPIVAALESLNDEMTVIANNIHETRNEAYQDPLNFGIKLNNRLAYLATHASSGDYPPTDEAQAYKEEVSAQIDQEILALEQLLDGRLPMINKMVAQQNIEVLSKP
jgi:hypothetical protein